MVMTVLAGKAVCCLTKQITGMDMILRGRKKWKVQKKEAVDRRASSN